jgi:hypothetical protein
MEHLFGEFAEVQEVEEALVITFGIKEQIWTEHWWESHTSFRHGGIVSAVYHLGILPSTLGKDVADSADEA